MEPKKRNRFLSRECFFGAKKSFDWHLKSFSTKSFSCLSLDCFYRYLKFHWISKCMCSTFACFCWLTELAEKSIAAKLKRSPSNNDERAKSAHAQAHVRQQSDIIKKSFSGTFTCGFPFCFCLFFFFSSFKLCFCRVFFLSVVVVVFSRVTGMRNPNQRRRMMWCS